MNNSFGPVLHTPLRVYLAGSADPEWRLSLLQLAAHEAYAVAVQQGDDVILQGALPYNHSMVGPFQVRTQLAPGDLQPREVFEWQRGVNVRNVERHRLRAIERCDIVFAWVPRLWDNAIEALALDFGAELGIAYGLGKAVVIATNTAYVLEKLPLVTQLAWKMIAEKDARAAYYHVMADLDVTFDRGMVKLTAKTNGRCAYCRSSYNEGETVYWSKRHDGIHVDCHARLQQANRDVNAIIFNSELVGALREDNANLEQECLDLKTKMSMLEQEKKVVEADLDDLYVEYLKMAESGP